VATAAAALLAGVPDPIAFLAQHPDDYVVAVGIVRKALQMDSDRRKEEFQAIVPALAEMTGVACGNQVAKILGRMFK